MPHSLEANVGRSVNLPFLVFCRRLELPTLAWLRYGRPPYQAGDVSRLAAPALKVLDIRVAPFSLAV